MFDIFLIVVLLLLFSKKVIIFFGYLILLSILIQMSNYIFNYLILKIKSYKYETALRFNDLYQTEVFIHDVKAYRKSLTIDKGYIIDVATLTVYGEVSIITLRYGNRSERDKDYESLTYELRKHGLKT